MSVLLCLAIIQRRFLAAIRNTILPSTGRITIAAHDAKNLFSEHNNGHFPNLPPPQIRVNSC
jgi:hypothetical protein